MTLDEFQAQGSRFIAFDRRFLLLGNTSLAVFLSQAVYWCRVKHGDWFYKNREEWEQETGIGRWEQETIRKRLRDLGVLEEDRHGPHGVLNFRVDVDALCACLKAAEERNQTVGKPQGGQTTRWANHHLDGGQTTNHKVVKPPSLTYTKSTAKSSLQITTAPSAKKGVVVVSGPGEFGLNAPDEHAFAAAELLGNEGLNAVYQFTRVWPEGKDRETLLENIAAHLRHGATVTLETLQEAARNTEAAYVAGGVNRKGRTLKWFINQLGDMIAGQAEKGQAVAEPTFADEAVAREYRSLLEKHGDGRSAGIDLRYQAEYNVRYNARHEESRLFKLQVAAAEAAKGAAK